MPRPAVFFDRDNTLIHNDGYLGDPEAVRLLHGAAAAVARCRAAGLAVVTVSNQSGVGRGLITEDDVRAVDGRMDDLLERDDPAAVVDRHYFCPYHPEAKVEAYRRDSDLRKPRPGMLLAAAADLDLDLSASWLVGDAPRDVAAGRAAGCRTIWLQDSSVAPSPAAAEAEVAADYVAHSLEEAAQIIVNDDAGSGRDAEAPRAPEPPAGAGLPHDADRATLEAILSELRRGRGADHGDFNVTRLLAAMAQVLALGVLFLAYLNDDPVATLQLLVTAVFVQVMAATLLLMR